MPRSGPITMTFPPFAGATRRLVLANVAVFFTLALMHWVAPGITDLLTERLLLEPARVATGMLWQPLTYAFIQLGLLDILFGMLTLWFCGSLLEGAYGSRWIYELFFSSTIGGAIVASLITFTRVFALNPHDIALGAWSGIFGLLGGDRDALWRPGVPAVLRYPAKGEVHGHDLHPDRGGRAAEGRQRLFGAAATFGGAVRIRVREVRSTARAGVRVYGTVLGLRNDYYRWKRRRAARKFEVYMRGQNREVHFDKDGRYVDPDDLRTRNPKDKSWMN